MDAVPSLSFGSPTDLIKYAVGPYTTFNWNQFTALALVRLVNDGNNDWLSTENSGATYLAGTGTNTGRAYYYENNTATFTSTPVTIDGHWHVCAVSKVTGSGVTPRFHLYDFTTTAWSHVNGNSASNPSVAMGVGGHFFSSVSQSGVVEIAALGLWIGTNMADATIVGFATSSLNAWQAQNPSALWICQGATGFVDVMGNCAQTSKVGTSAGQTSPLDYTAGSPPQTVNAQLVTLTLTGVAGALVQGAAPPQSKTAQLAALTLTGMAGAPTVGSAPNQTVTAQVAALTLTGVAAPSTGGPSTATAQVAVLTLTGLAGTTTAGTGTVTAQVATLTLTAPAGVFVGGPTVRAAQLATLDLVGIAGNGSVVGGGTAPTVVTVGTRTGTTVALTWTAPPAGGIIAIYNVETSLDNSVWTFNVTSVGNAASALAQGLTPFTTYYFGVQAVFVGTGPGPYSAAVLATTTTMCCPARRSS